MNLQMRKAKMSDVSSLAILYNQLWEVNKTEDPVLIVKRKLTPEDQLTVAKKDIKKKQVFTFVAVVDNKVVGFIQVTIQKNKDLLYKVRKFGFMDAAVVAKEYRGRGIARALTNHVMNFLKKKEIKYVKTEVINKNKIAMKTWTKLGFKPVSSILIKTIR